MMSQFELQKRRRQKSSAVQHPVNNNSGKPVTGNTTQPCSQEPLTNTKPGLLPFPALVPFNIKNSTKVGYCVPYHKGNWNMSQSAAKTNAQNGAPDLPQLTVNISQNSAGKNGKNNLSGSSGFCSSVDSNTHLVANNRPMANTTNMNQSYGGHQQNHIGEDPSNSNSQQRNPNLQPTLPYNRRTSDGHRYNGQVRYNQMNSYGHNSHNTGQTWDNGQNNGQTWVNGQNNMWSNEHPATKSGLAFYNMGPPMQQRSNHPNESTMNYGHEDRHPRPQKHGNGPSTALHSMVPPMQQGINNDLKWGNQQSFQTYQVANKTQEQHSRLHHHGNGSSTAPYNMGPSMQQGVNNDLSWGYQRQSQANPVVNSIGTREQHGNGPSTATAEDNSAAQEEDIYFLDLTVPLHGRPIEECVRLLSKKNAQQIMPNDSSQQASYNMLSYNSGYYQNGTHCTQNQDQVQVHQEPNLAPQLMANAPYAHVLGYSDCPEISQIPYAQVQQSDGRYVMGPNPYYEGPPIPSLVLMKQSSTHTSEKSQNTSDAYVIARTDPNYTAPPMEPQLMASQVPIPQPTQQVPYTSGPAPQNSEVSAMIPNQYYAAPPIQQHYNPPPQPGVPEQQSSNVQQNSGGPMVPNPYYLGTTMQQQQQQHYAPQESNTWNAQSANMADNNNYYGISNQNMVQQNNNPSAAVPDTQMTYWNGPPPQPVLQTNNWSNQYTNTTDCYPFQPAFKEAPFNGNPQNGTVNAWGEPSRTSGYNSMNEHSVSPPDVPLNNKDNIKNTQCVQQGRYLASNNQGYNQRGTSSSVPQKSDGYCRYSKQSGHQYYNAEPASHRSSRRDQPSVKANTVVETMPSYVSTKGVEVQNRRMETKSSRSGQPEVKVTISTQKIPEKTSVTRPEPTCHDAQTAAYYPQTKPTAQVSISTFTNTRTASSRLKKHSADIVPVKTVTMDVNKVVYSGMIMLTWQHPTSKDVITYRLTCHDQYNRMVECQDFVIETQTAEHKIFTYSGMKYQVHIAATSMNGRCLLAEWKSEISTAFPSTDIARAYSQSLKLHLEHQNQPNASKEISVAYRFEYSQKISHICMHKNYQMSPFITIKGVGGQIHDIKGLIFSIKTYSDGKLPKCSWRGDALLQYHASAMFNPDFHRFYFADFVTRDQSGSASIVVCYKHSPSDDYCSKQLVSLDPFNNPFIRVEPKDGNYKFFATTAFTVTVFYAEYVDLRLGKTDLIQMVSRPKK